MKTDLRSAIAVDHVGLAGLARATRSLVALSDNEVFDVVRFLEIDAPKVFPEFYLFIESDDSMDGSKAFVTEDSLSIVVAESVYNDAVAGYFYARKILAHEFGHILLHHDMPGHLKHFTYGPYRKQARHADTIRGAEWQADTFAILLLVPPMNVKHGELCLQFTKENKMSQRMREFVQARVASVRRKNGAANQTNAQDVINSLLCFAKARSKPMPSIGDQLAFF